MVEHDLELLIILQKVHTFQFPFKDIIISTIERVFMIHFLCFPFKKVQ